MKTKIAVLSVLLAGCSTVSVQHPMVLKQDEKVTVYYCVKSTAQMNILDKTLSKEKNQTRFDEQKRVAMGAIDDYFGKNLVKSPNLSFEKISSCPELTAIPHNPTSLYLTVTLSGYGTLNERWKKLFIGSGIVEGTVQGVVVGTATQNPWLGVAVAAEEFGQEYLTWNGIDWLMGETYAPVTLEGELVLASNEKTIWKDSEFITDNSDELDKMPKEQKKKKDVQLQASLHKAESELASSLNAYFAHEILPGGVPGLE